jgi:hypothetical protein
MSTPSHNAAPSALGYLYQVRLALKLCLQKYREGKYASRVSLEILDDVAFEHDGGSKELLQQKHSIHRIASLTNGSVDFWKSVKVWVDGIESKLVSVDDGSFLLITCGTIPDDSHLAVFKPDSKEDRPSTVKKLVDHAATLTTPAVASAVKALRKLDGEIQAKLFERIIIIDGAENILEVSEQIVQELSLSVRAEHVVSLKERLEGWWFDWAIKHLFDPKNTPAMALQGIKSKIDDISDEFRRGSLPNDFPEVMALQETDVESPNLHFITQLRMIFSGPRNVQNALSDYYRAFHQRSKWLRENLVAVDELDKYEEKLIAEWQCYFEIMQESLNADSTESEKRKAGQALYQALVLEAQHFIRASFTEPYLMRGSYHMLADIPKVGWHLDFESRLNQLLARVFEEVTA